MLIDIKHKIIHCFSINSNQSSKYSRIQVLEEGFSEQGSLFDEQCIDLSLSTRSSLLKGETKQDLASGH